MSVDSYQARTSLAQLQEDLRVIIAADPNASVDGPAIDVIEAILKAAGQTVPEHPVVSALESKIPLERIQAKDALIIAGQLFAAIPQPGIAVA
jgi:hypothetical protein